MTTTIDLRLSAVDGSLSAPIISVAVIEDPAIIPLLLKVYGLRPHIPIVATMGGQVVTGLVYDAHGVVVRGQPIGERLP